MEGIIRSQVKFCKWFALILLAYGTMAVATTVYNYYDYSSYTYDSYDVEYDESEPDVNVTVPVDTSVANPEVEPIE